MKLSDNSLNHSFWVFL